MAEFLKKNVFFLFFFIFISVIENYFSLSVLVINKNTECRGPCPNPIMIRLFTVYILKGYIYNIYILYI